MQVNVWIDAEYKKCETIEVSAGLTREQVEKEVNNKFGKSGWCYFDIIPKTIN